MKLTDRVLKWLHSDPRFAAWTPDQSLVALDCLLAVVMADERITEPEWERLMRELERLPWSWDEGSVKLRARIEDARLRVERRVEEVRDGRFQREVATRLAEPSLRRELYRMMVAIALADGLDAREQASLEHFRDAFALDRGAAERIIAAERARLGA